MWNLHTEFNNFSSLEKKNENEVWKLFTNLPLVSTVTLSPKICLFPFFPWAEKVLVIHLSIENDRFVNASKHFLLS